MRQQMDGVFTRILLALTIIPNLVIAAGIFTPRIENHGTYKTLKPKALAQVNALKGHVPIDVKQAKKLSPMSDKEILKLAIALPLNNELELDQRLLEITNPKSPHFRHYLSQEEYMARYAPTEEQVNAVRSHLKARGILVTSVDKNRLLLHASGTVKNINAVFNTEIYHFLDSKGAQFYAPAYEIQVDKALNIHSVHGLENVFKAHPHSEQLKTSNKVTGLGPSDIATAYAHTSDLNGSGQTVAIFALDAYTASDIAAYQAAYSLPSITVTPILVDGASGIPGSNADQVTMDIELMMALAPGVSEILVYEGVNSSAGILYNYNQIATDNTASIITTAWGASESAAPGSLVSTEALIFKEMVAQGQSVFVASGNNGAYDDGTDLGVEDPATQPLVTAVGGTTITLNIDGSYASETTWYDSSANAGSGGGISSIWYTTFWQQEVVYNQPGISYTNRSVPDVTAHSDPHAGYAIYFDGDWQVYGGTSASATLWAAFAALANQSLLANGYNALGLSSPFLYQAGTDLSYTTYFNDIADNSTNGYSQYQAVAGYDIPTGLGSFSIDNLIGYFNDNSAPANTCFASNPIIGFGSNWQSADPGDALPFDVFIMNQDTPECGSSTYDVSLSLPSGFTSSLSQSTVTLQPNQTATITATITSPSDATAGANSFSITAVNEGNNTLVASANATYEVFTDRGTSPNLSIEALDGTSFSQSAGGWVKFEVIMSADGDGVNGQVVDIEISGPISLTDSGTTMGDGSFLFLLYINEGLVVGDYTFAVSTTYDGNPVSNEIAFTITE